MAGGPGSPVVEQLYKRLRRKYVLLRDRCVKSLRGEGVTRIALRKYTSFGVHLAVKHVGAWHTSKHQPFQRHLAVKHFGARSGNTSKHQPLQRPLCG